MYRREEYQGSTKSKRKYLRGEEQRANKVYGGGPYQHVCTTTKMCALYIMISYILCVYM